MRAVWLALVIGLVVPAARLRAVGPEEARRVFIEGQARLAQGEFDAALDAFKSAARKERSNEEYDRQYKLLRQVLQLRKSLPKEKDPEKWLTGASALHAYYHDHGLFGQSLPLDEERFRRQATAESAVLLAQTQFALESHSEVVERLAALPPEVQSPHTRVLHALALSRLGRLEEARSLLADRGSFDGLSDPECFLDLGRVLATTGDPKDALSALKRSLELTPPSRLEAHKARLAKCPEFAAVADTAEFGEVLATPSTIKESPCSGGAGCSKCPKRAKCGSAAATPDPEKK